MNITQGIVSAAKRKIGKIIGWILYYISGILLNIVPKWVDASPVPRPLYASHESTWLSMPRRTLARSTLIPNNLFFPFKIMLLLTSPTWPGIPIMQRTPSQKPAGSGNRGMPHRRTHSTISLRVMNNWIFFFSREFCEEFQCSNLYNNQILHKSSSGRGSLCDHEVEN